MTKSSRNGQARGKLQSARSGGGRPASAPRDGAGRDGAGRDGAARLPRPRAGRESSGLWLYGTHAVAAALANPARYVHEVRATASAAAELPPCPVEGRPRPRLDEGEAISRLLPPGAVHQGIAARVEPLEDLSLDEVLEPAQGLAVMLDQVSDPQNAGAIFRTAAAFGARAVIQQDRNSAPVTGALAKAAAGALELVPDVRVVNLSQAIRKAQELGWRVIGLAGEAGAPLPALLDGQPTLLVMGAEGRGLRELVGRSCDALGRIEIHAQMESLNVSVATGIALAFAAQAQAQTQAARPVP
jgi:23S rRNA (guanosine2251-2'-O)-methyltransferase